MRIPFVQVLHEPFALYGWQPTQFRRVFQRHECGECVAVFLAFVRDVLAVALPGCSVI